MKRIQTYVVNLRSSVARRKYMEDLLGQYNSIRFEFIDAIDGRKMSEQELLQKFDRNTSRERYGRELNMGEIGCVLSHRKAIKSFLMSDFPYALILEDDVSIVRDLNALNSYDLETVLDCTSPVVLFLSGDYWYFNRNGNVVSCYDALGAYAYILNREAAKLMLRTHKPYFVADDWGVHRRYGLKLRAIQPYMIDANLNMNILDSDVKQDQWGVNRMQMSKIELLRSVISSSIKRLLKMLGLFESKIRVIDGRVVDCKD